MEDELEGELGVLEAVYSEALEITDDHGSPGTKVIHIRLGDDVESGVRLSIFVSPAYPHEMPPFELKGVNWKVFDQAALYEGLERIRENQEGGPFLYQWIDHVKEFLSSAEAGGVPSYDEEEEEEEEEEVVDLEAWRRIGHDDGVARASSEEGVVEVEIMHGEPLMDRKSVFQAHLAKIRSEREAMQVLEVLKRDKKVARATHNMYAYRVFDVEKGAQVADNDDDGENAAGGKMAELLSMMGVNDVLVVVSRWYGGIQLGPDRFRHINNVARQILEENGFERKGGGGKASSGKCKK